jgi:hypothetical protein
MIRWSYDYGNKRSYLVLVFHLLFNLRRNFIQRRYRQYIHDCKTYYRCINIVTSTYVIVNEVLHFDLQPATPNHNNFTYKNFKALFEYCSSLNFFCAFLYFSISSTFYKLISWIGKWELVVKREREKWANKYLFEHLYRSLVDLNLKESIMSSAIRIPEAMSFSPQANLLIQGSLDA